MIRSVDRTLVPKDEPRFDHPQDEPEDAPEGPQPPLSTSIVVGGNVRILFLHASNVPNASAQASNIVTAFNKSLSLSAVSSNNSISIAGVQQVASNFAGMNRSAIINAMANRSAPFTNIDTSMDNTYADVAFLLVQEDPTAADMPGYGRIGGVAWLQNQANPFALSTDDYALGDLTALHELGHVFGGRHEDVANAGIARPVVAVDDTWMTIMGGVHRVPVQRSPRHLRTAQPLVPSRSDVHGSSARYPWAAGHGVMAREQHAHGLRVEARAAGDRIYE
ncbi:zinc-dependent metalloprotease family protein [Polyangium mundeleinium]|uniref:Zinc-dependent metalloprotease family protein n=1 Tax=Polyangium mundeleinium TaxID=2995306 RepID=A0ABT5EX90_9BACT|nr:zinc-dependent metalloprotease family protein [Polyangium mundeleinium]MDC0746430.1 zinc-dependent metalloprotease family protein [Polyangium mundeleinium]